MVDKIIEVFKIISPAILTGLITFLITRYTYRRNIPLDKLEKAYDKVYYPIYCLIKSDKPKEKIVEKCRRYLEKYRKYVDITTIIALENVLKSDNAENGKKAYNTFKLNIYNMDSRLRKRLGYLEANMLDLYRYSSPNKKMGVRLCMYTIVVYVLLLFFTFLPSAIRMQVSLLTLKLFVLVIVFELIFMLCNLLYSAIKRAYRRHKKKST